MVPMYVFMAKITSQCPVGGWVGCYPFVRLPETTLFPSGVPPPPPTPKSFVLFWSGYPNPNPAPRLTHQALQGACCVGGINNLFVFF